MILLQDTNFIWKIFKNNFKINRNKMDESALIKTAQAMVADA